MSGMLKFCWKRRRGFAVAVVTCVAVFVFLRAERHFSSTGFCTSCHAMTYPYEELKRGSHYGARGIDPGCGDCHLPPEFFKRNWVHVTSGIKDIVSAATNDFSTPEKFNERRADLVRKAVSDLKKWDSSPCRACHKNPRPGSAFGRAAHEALKTGEGATCIDCHRGIFHVRAADEEKK